MFQIMEYSSTESINSSRNISEEVEIPERFFEIFFEIFVLISLTCVVANIFIIFVTVKYKRLRREKWSIIILNWAIINCPLMISAPITFGLTVHVPKLIARDSTFCFVQHTELTLFLINIILIVILTIYWYMKLYHTEKHKKLDQHIKCVLIFLYIFFIALTGLNIDACYNSRVLTVTGIIVILSYLAFILFMPIINIIHAIRMRKLVDYSNSKNIPFILSNVLFLSQLPSIVIIFTRSFFSPFTNNVLMSVGFFIATLNPIYFFLVLYFYDRNYNVFLKHVFTCRCKEYNDELVEQPVSYNNGIENT